MTSSLNFYKALNIGLVYIIKMIFFIASFLYEDYKNINLLASAQLHFDLEIEYCKLVIFYSAILFKFL